MHAAAVERMLSMPLVQPYSKVLTMPLVQPYYAAGATLLVMVCMVGCVHGCVHAGMVATVAGSVYRAGAFTDVVGAEALLTTGSLELHCDASGGVRTYHIPCVMHT